LCLWSGWQVVRATNVGGRSVTRGLAVRGDPHACPRRSRCGVTEPRRGSGELGARQPPPLLWRVCHFPLPVALVVDHDFDSGFGSGGSDVRHAWLSFSCSEWLDSLFLPRGGCSTAPRPHPRTPAPPRPLLSSTRRVAYGRTAGGRGGARGRRGALARRPRSDSFRHSRRRGGIAGVERWAAPWRSYDRLHRERSRALAGALASAWPLRGVRSRGPNSFGT
jgi:hypothetical protein